MRSHTQNQTGETHYRLIQLGFNEAVVGVASTCSCDLLATPGYASDVAADGLLGDLLPHMD